MRQPAWMFGLSGSNRHTPGDNLPLDNLLSSADTSPSSHRHLPQGVLLLSFILPRLFPRWWKSRSFGVLIFSKMTWFLYSLSGDIFLLEMFLTKYYFFVVNLEKINRYYKHHLVCWIHAIIEILVINVIKKTHVSIFKSYKYNMLNINWLI